MEKLKYSLFYIPDSIFQIPIMFHKKKRENKKIKKMQHKKLFQAPRGMPDILPEDQIYWDKIEKTIKDFARFYRFLSIKTPLLEESDLYAASTGTSTDIVHKQLFSFKSRGDEDLTLRPEGTPSIARAYLERGLSNIYYPAKLFYLGPMYRYERPQKGRFREFCQAGFEVFGSADPAYDAQIILIFAKILEELKIKNFSIQINSIGCAACRNQIRKKIKNYYRRKLDYVCRDCKRRYKENVFRILDCKNENCAIIKKSAPIILDHLCKNCHNHFKEVLEYLDHLALPYILNNHLVRGLDYYAKTVFEIWPSEELGKILNYDPSNYAFGAGGRFDYLIESLGGKSTPAVGCALGINRIVEFLKENKIKISQPEKPKAFLVNLGILAKRESFNLLENFRKEGILVIESFARESIKAQLKTADKENIPFTLILGQKEVLDKNIIIRDMASGAQETIPVEKIVEMLKKKLK